jgi:hypothetical protein
MTTAAPAQRRTHTCRALGCTAEIPKAHLMCGQVGESGSGDVPMADLHQAAVKKARAKKHTQHVWVCPLCGTSCRGNGACSSHKRKHLREAGLAASDWPRLLQEPQLLVGRPGIKAEFWALVDTSGGPDACWPWLGKKATRRCGYGVFNRFRKPAKAHRLAYEFTHGPCPSGLFVCHHCDVPSCCNPAHLFVGTPQDNVDDMRRKNRHAHGERSSSAKLTVARVRTIKRLLAAGMVQRRIAAIFGVLQSTISDIATGTTWKEACGAH